MAKTSTYVNFAGQTEAAFAALSEGGKVVMPMADVFWGAYFGSFADRFGLQWMINCRAAP